MSDAVPRRDRANVAGRRRRQRTGRVTKARPATFNPTDLPDEVPLETQALTDTPSTDARAFGTDIPSPGLSPLEAYSSTGDAGADTSVMPGDSDPSDDPSAGIAEAAARGALADIAAAGPSHLATPVVPRTLTFESPATPAPDVSRVQISNTPSPAQGNTVFQTPGVVQPRVKSEIPVEKGPRVRQIQLFETVADVRKRANQAIKTLQKDDLHRKSLSMSEIDVMWMFAQRVMKDIKDDVDRATLRILRRQLQDELEDMNDSHRRVTIAKLSAGQMKGAQERLRKVILEIQSCRLKVQSELQALKNEHTTSTNKRLGEESADRHLKKLRALRALSLKQAIKKSNSRSATSKTFLVKMNQSASYVSHIKQTNMKLEKIIEKLSS